MEKTIINKKGTVSSIVLVLILPVFIIITLFSMFTYNLLTTDIGGAAATEVSSAMSLNPTQTAQLDTLIATANPIPYELIFAILFIAVIAWGIYDSITDIPLGHFMFMFVLIIGNMLILALAYFLEKIYNYFLVEVFPTIFYLNYTDYATATFLFDNYLWLVFVLTTLFLSLKQVQPSFGTGGGGIEE